MDCKLIEQCCVIKPLGLESSCFLLCPHAMAFLRQHSLSAVDPGELSWYLEDISWDMKDSSLKECFEKVIEFIKSKGY